MTRDIDRENYAELYGPTTGDKIRLGDTELFAEVEKTDEIKVAEGVNQQD